MKQGSLIAIGGAYVDINVPDFPFNEHGLRLESEAVGQAYRLEPGGSAVNFARLCGTLGVPTTFVGKVGEDEFGTILSNLLLGSRVTPSLIVSDNVSTNVSFNMVNTDDKSIMVVAGTANQALTADEVYSTASEHMDTSSSLFLGGCFKLKKLMPAFISLAEDAKSVGTRVILDHGRLNDGVTESEKEVVRQLALRADIYLPSCDEFIQLWSVSSISEGLAKLTQKTAGITIVKNGDKGAVAMVDDEVITIPAFSVKPIHTIGAGDSFNAGFIAAQDKGKDLLECIKFGCATAALKISRESMPTFDDVAQFIECQDG